MVSWSNFEKLCSCSRTWMVSALACGNKWIQGGTYRGMHAIVYRNCVQDYDGLKYKEYIVGRHITPSV